MHLMESNSTHLRPRFIQACDDALLVLLHVIGLAAILLVQHRVDAMTPTAWSGWCIGQLAHGAVGAWPNGARWMEVTRRGAGGRTRLGRG